MQGFMIKQKKPQIFQLTIYNLCTEIESIHAQILQSMHMYSTCRRFPCEMQVRLLSHVSQFSMRNELRSRKQAYGWEETGQGFRLWQDVDIVSQRRHRFHWGLGVGLLTANQLCLGYSKVLSYFLHLHMLSLSFALNAIMEVFCRAHDRSNGGK